MIIKVVVFILLIVLSFVIGLFAGYWIKDNKAEPDNITEINNAKNIVKGKLKIRERLKIRRNGKNKRAN